MIRFTISDDGSRPRLASVQSSWSIIQHHSKHAHTRTCIRSCTCTSPFGTIPLMSHPGRLLCQSSKQEQQEQQHICLVISPFLVIGSMAPGASHGSVPGSNISFLISTFSVFVFLVSSLPRHAGRQEEGRFSLHHLNIVVALGHVFWFRHGKHRALVGAFKHGKRARERMRGPTGRQFLLQDTHLCWAALRKGSFFIEWER